MTILSIQSHVAYGHVGNSAAVFPLQRLGVEVWPVHTVQFACHAGYGPPKGRITGPDAIADIIAGIEERGVLSLCHGVLSGYVGSAATGAAILDAVALVKRANPQALYCCDPVFGDADSGVYVAADIIDFFRDAALPAADLLTPNRFELEVLTGRKIATLDDALSAMAELRRRGPRAVLATSVATVDTPAGAIDVLACDDGGCVRVRTPRLPLSVSGAGDVVAALFLAHYLRSGSVAEAASQAVSAIHSVIARTAELGQQELALIAAQDDIVEPRRVFQAEMLEARV
jgi:pyridoxine kinase